MKYIFKSKRLGFRNWTEEDKPKMILINVDPVVMEYFPYVARPDQTLDFIERMQSMQHEKGYCYFAVDELETGEFIGFIGLCDQNFDVEFCPCTDIGWRLDSKYWNRGYATEGATACVDYAFETIGLKEVFSAAPVINTASINIMLKMGMEKYLNYVHPKLIDNKRLKNCVCYKITNS